MYTTAASYDVESGRDAYIVSRGDMWVDVEPSVLPGQGFIVGNTYAVKIYAPATETVSWSISRGEPNAYATLRQSAPDGSDARAFTFKPTADGEHVIRVEAVAPAPLTARNAIVIRQPATATTAAVRLSALVVYMGACVFVAAATAVALFFIVRKSALHGT